MGLINLYPVLLLLAAVIVLVRLTTAPSRRGGWHWFGAWCPTGAVFSFSYVTGLSIGLLVLPFAVALLLLTAWFAPGFAEALGFVAGIGLVLLLIGYIQREGEAVSPAPFLIGGIFVCMLALGGYVILREEYRPPRRGSDVM